MSRTPFSINLDEDYEIYGIDPNEDLDDWSFLDAKPEPIPEKDEEEKRLFEALLKPSISEDEIQHEIHDRLKSLLDETSKFIENDVKVELSSPIEISPEQIEQNINKESFEHKQAERVSSIVKDILRTTQESEDIDNLIQNLTKSDKVADVIKEEELNSSQQLNLKLNNSEVKNEIKKELKNEMKKEDESIPKPQVVKEETRFLDRYKRKPGEKSQILRDHDETERLSSKFILERKKRKEADKAELERKIKEREEKQKQFFESLDIEAEKHRREVQMIKEMKESKAPTLSEMLNQIKQPETPVKQEINPQLLSKKQPEKQKQPRYTKEKIDEFLSNREKRLSAFQQPQKYTVLVVELSSEKSKVNDKKTNQNDLNENKPHFSKTYQKMVTDKLTTLLGPAIKEFKEKKKKDPRKLWKIAIFFRLSCQIALNKHSKKIKQRRMRKFLKRWRRRRSILKCKKTFSAIKIQRAFQKFNAKRKQKNEITDKQILDKARQLMAQHSPEVAKQMSKASDKNQQQKPINKNNFKFPALKDPDMSWLDNLENSKDTSLNFSDDGILDELPNKPILNLRDKPSPRRSFQAESTFEPFDTDTYGFLSKFGQKIDLGDDADNDDISNIDINSLNKSKSRPSNNSQPGSNNQTPQRSSQQAHQQLQQTPSPSQGENETGGSYNFKNKSTTKMMQKMINKKLKTANPYKNEKPVDKFNRLYGGPTGVNSQDRPVNHVQPVTIKRSEFRTNDTRTKRLKQLKKVWLNPPSMDDTET